MDDRRPLLEIDALATTGRGALVVALSGGLDSTVLLHALSALAPARARGLRALHIHHGLQPCADEWARQCEEICAAWGVPLGIRRVDVLLDTGEGLEAAARRARHAAFHAELAPGEVLAMAHHQDDQAETFLLRALRASGPEGLAAMAPWRAFGRGWMWRPLLGLPRARLEEYARQHGLSWIEDPSNDDTVLDRNFLRRQVLPLLRERWPHASAAFATSAGLCAQAEALLAAQDAAALAEACTGDPRVLQRAALRALDPARQARVLRRWIRDLDLPPLPAQGVVHIQRDLLDARADAQARFQWQDARVEAWGELLCAHRPRPPLPEDWRQDWDGADLLPLPGGGSLTLECADASGRRFDHPVIAHARQGGERIRLPGRAHSHSLKNVLQDLDVPPWERERLPLLSSAQGELLAAGDLAYAAGFDSWLRARGARLRWLPD